MNNRYIAVWAKAVRHWQIILDILQISLWSVVLKVQNMSLGI